MDAETKNLLSGNCLGYLDAWVASLQGRILEDNGGRLKEVRLSSFTVDDLGKEFVFAVRNDSRLASSNPDAVLTGIMKQKGWYRLEDYKPSQR